MDSSVLGVVVDSSIVIEAERQRLNVARFLKYLASRVGEREAALSAITVAELAHGIYRANSPQTHQIRRAFLDDLRAALPVYPITAETAELAGRISAETAQQGVNIPFDDLFIGACALERGYAVATRNQRHFQKIPGLTLLHP